MTWTCVGDHRSRKVLVRERASLSVREAVGECAASSMEALDISNRRASFSQPAIVGFMEGTFINNLRDNPHPRFLHAGRRRSGEMEEVLGTTLPVTWQEFKHYSLRTHVVFARLDAVWIIMALVQC